jgi:hypothetical protein
MCSSGSSMTIKKVSLFVRRKLPMRISRIRVCREMRPLPCLRDGSGMFVPSTKCGTTASRTPSLSVVVSRNFNWDGRPKRRAISALTLLTRAWSFGSFSSGRLGDLSRSRSSRTAAVGFPPAHATARRKSSELKEIMRSQVRLAGNEKKTHLSDQRNRKWGNR